MADQKRTDNIAMSPVHSFPCPPPVYSPNSLYETPTGQVYAYTRYRREFYAWRLVLPTFDPSPVSRLQLLELAKTQL